MIVTEIATFKLREISRDEIVDAMKLFVVLRPDTTDHIVFVANPSTWNRVSLALTEALYDPAKFSSLLGCPIVVDTRYADGRFDVVFTDPATTNQYVLGLEFPEEFAPTCSSDSAPVSAPI